MKRIDHIGVIVEDLPASGRLLSEVMGFELEREVTLPEAGLAARFYRSGEAFVELIQVLDPEAAAQRLRGERPAHLEHIALEVEDLRQTAQELAARGVRMASEEPLNGPNTLIFFTEPSTTGGIMFQLVQKLQT